MTRLPDGSYYEVELIPMGRVVNYTGPGETYDTTADEAEWTDGQTTWCVWCVLRNDETHDIEEVLDIDIPVALKDLAMSIFFTVNSAVEKANLLRVPMT